MPRAIVEMDAELLGDAIRPILDSGVRIVRSEPSSDGFVSLVLEGFKLPGGRGPNDVVEVRALFTKETYGKQHMLRVEYKEIPKRESVPYTR